jgi:hypothetical protein
MTSQTQPPRSAAGAVTADRAGSNDLYHRKAPISLPMTGMDAARAFLAAFVHDADGTRRDGVLQLPYRLVGRDGMTAAHASTGEDVRQVAARVVALAERADVWVGTQLLRHVPRRRPDGRQPRGGRADTSGLVAVVADIDKTAPGRAAVTTSGLPLPTTDDEALSIFSAVPAPTVLVSSGAGFQSWWLLDEHARLPVDEAERITSGWCAMLAEQAARLGYHLDKTGDLARVLRLPGTVNHKPGYGAPTVAIVATGPRYRLGELATLIPPSEPAPVPEPTPDVVRVLDVPAGSDDYAARITDAWSSRTDWADLLVPFGWRLYRDNGAGNRLWTRPDKAGSPSASTHDDPPVMWVYSSSSILPNNATLTKLNVLAHLAHGGDVRSAWHSIAPPLDTNTPDVDRLSRFVATGDPGGTGGRLVWAVRQMAGRPGADGAVRRLIDSAAGCGMPRGAAAVAARRGLRTADLAGRAA